MADRAASRRRRTVAGRVLLSYAIVLMAFALAAGWSVVAQREAAREANLMRSGYLPLALALRDMVQNQDTWNTQLNHITAARNPADIRVWFDAAQRIGRPRLFGGVRAAISRAFLGSSDERVRSVGLQLLRETGQIEEFLRGDSDAIDRLFQTLERRDDSRADQLSAELVTRGLQGRKRLSQLEQSVQRHVDQLIDQARARERLAIRLLVGLSALTLLVGIAMALYARRVLEPLAAVTERAKAVARGDLTPRAVVASRDEIGELAATFESMVSAIARASGQLLAAERLATIGKMAAHVTHEIRNPLSSIALNVELLEEELADADGESRALLRAIKAEVERLTALSEQYLSVARQQPLRLEDEEVGQLVREASDFMRRDLERHGVSITLDVEQNLPTVRADESQVKQALYNLIRNAREAMPGGGAIQVRVARRPGGVLVLVEDEGAGVDEETRARLFEPFFTTKTHGTGLGLAITRQIIEAHGGRIVCEPRSPRGTRMRIELVESVAPSEREQEEREPAKPEAPISARAPG
jgi:two-component system NtrC family sensor kinase